ncbi:MAG: molybdate ABC transporter permease subunit [Pseudomonadota bacterium]
MVEWSAVFLTIQLAAVSTVVLFVLGTPLAWWLAQTRHASKPILEAVTAMPLVLPPTVLGFYLLILMSPNATLGAFWVSLTGDSLTFSFSGLVIASVVYSLPFMVQPLQSAFENMGNKPLQAAASLGAGPLDRFFSVAVPQCLRGFLTAGVLTFAHTIGEFGVVLMVGGNIPEQTRVISIAIYENVEVLNYTQAHILSLGLLVFSFVVLFSVYATNRKFTVRVA